MALISILLKRKVGLEYVFLALFGPLSLGMMCVLPPSGAPDEVAHVERAIVVSQGVISGHQAALLPCFSLDGVNVSLSDVIDSFRGNQAKRKVLRHPVAEEGTAVYPVFAYVPQAFAIWTSRFATQNGIVHYYAARIGAWLVTVLFFFLAVRVAPVGKNIIIVLSTLPMALQESASASVDGMCISFFTFVAAALCRLWADRKLNAFMVWAAFPLGCLAVWLKVMYLPVVLLLLLVPVGEPWKTKRRTFRLLLVAGVLASALAWYFLSIAPHAGDGRLSTNVGVQMMLLKKSPLSFPSALVSTLLSYTSAYLKQFVGKDLSWYNIRLPHLFYYLYLTLLVVVMLMDARVRARTLALRVGLGCAASLCGLIVFFSLFVWWTPPGAGLIQGVQGRYFLPLALATLLCLPGRRNGETNSVAEMTCSYVEGVYRAVAFLGVLVLCFVFVERVI